MRYLRPVAAALLLLSSAVAYAHAHLQKAVPADGSTVSTAPTQAVLTFSESARLTACWLQKDGGEKQKITSLPTEPAKQVTVILPALTPGSYVLSWRVVGDDTHIVPGQIHFTVSGADTSS